MSPELIDQLRRMHNAIQIDEATKDILTDANTVANRLQQEESDHATAFAKSYHEMVEHTRNLPWEWILNLSSGPGENRQMVRGTVHYDAPDGEAVPTDGLRVWLTHPDGNPIMQGNSKVFATTENRDGQTHFVFAGLHLTDPFRVRALCESAEGGQVEPENDLLLTEDNAFFIEGVKVVLQRNPPEEVIIEFESGMGTHPARQQEDGSYQIQLADDLQGMTSLPFSMLVRNMPQGGKVYLFRTITFFDDKRRQYLGPAAGIRGQHGNIPSESATRIIGERVADALRQSATAPGITRTMVQIADALGIEAKPDKPQRHRRDGSYRQKVNLVVGNTKAKKWNAFSFLDAQLPGPRYATQLEIDISAVVVSADNLLTLGARRLRYVISRETTPPTVVLTVTEPKKNDTLTVGAPLKITAAVFGGCNTQGTLIVQINRDEITELVWSNGLKKDPLIGLQSSDIEIPTSSISKHSEARSVTLSVIWREQIGDGDPTESVVRIPMTIQGTPLPPHGGPTEPDSPEPEEPPGTEEPVTPGAGELKRLTPGTPGQPPFTQTEREPIEVDPVPNNNPETDDDVTVTTPDGRQLPPGESRVIEDIADTLDELVNPETGTITPQQLQLVQVIPMLNDPSKIPRNEMLAWVEEWDAQAVKEMKKSRRSTRRNKSYVNRGYYLSMASYLKKRLIEYSMNDADEKTAAGGLRFRPVVWFIIEGLNMQPDQLWYTTKASMFVNASHYVMRWAESHPPSTDVAEEENQLVDDYLDANTWKQYATKKNTFHLVDRDYLRNGFLNVVDPQWLKSELAWLRR